MKNMLVIEEVYPSHCTNCIFYVFLNKWIYMLIIINIIDEIY